MVELTQNPELEPHLDRELKTVLIVDDESMIRDLCKRALHGYRTLEAADGDEALKVYERGGIDLILTDVMMPKLDGIELLKRLKEREPTLLVIIMTGYADKELILKALKEDADDFITKPLNLLQLKSAIEKALVKKALKEEIANLKNLDRFKTNFLSLISHKFRTPITSISLFMQNLAAGVFDPESATDRENLGLVYEEACYLGSMVSELLSFSKVMDAGNSIRPEPCDLNTLIPDLVRQTRDRCDKPGVTTSLDLEPVPMLMLDRERISFALQQLLDNSIKFCRDNGCIAVEMRCTEQGCRITVTDDGIGIPKEELPKVFEKFYQVDRSKSGQIRGFGLGLFYAREFVRMHGGSIGIESQEGIGTRVTITLPSRTGTA